MPSYASWLASSCPRPSYTGSGQAQKARGGAAFSIFPFFFIKNKKTDENELTAKKMNTKALKTVMIVDEQSWGGGGRERGRGRTRGPPPCLLSVSVRPCLQEGAPPQSPEAWPEGEGTRAWGLGAQAPPSEAQGAGGKKGSGRLQKPRNYKTKYKRGHSWQGEGPRERRERSRPGRLSLRAPRPQGPSQTL